MNEIFTCRDVPARFLLIGILTGIFIAPAFAEHKALWEFGLGAGSVHAPLYRGAKQSREYNVPIPFIRYRGEIFAADEEGMRGLLYDHGRWEVDVSFAGSLPVSKSDDGPRVGMPSLDPIVQFGPAANYLLSRTSSANTKNIITLEFPVRTVLSIGNPTMEHRGWAMSPSLNWVYQIRENGSSWRMSLKVGPLFADAKFHNYVYQVEQPYANAQRIKYDAHSGYGGSRLTIRLSRNSPQFYFGLFARFDNLKDAAFADSPLVETEQYGLYGIAAAWIFSKSDSNAKHWK